MNKYKQWIITFSILSLSAALILGGLIVFADPYFQFHGPVNKLNYIVDDQLTQNPGMARHLNYNAVILGSSVTVNYDTSWFNEDFDALTVKLPYNGAYPKDYANILKQIDLSGNELKYVFWSMDVGSFSGELDETKYPINKTLYDTNPFNDISYIFNKDVLFKYVIFPNLSSGNRGNSSYNYSQNQHFNSLVPLAYSTFNDLKYGREYCLDNFLSLNPDIDEAKLYRILDNNESIRILSSDSMDPNSFIPAATANMKENILPFIESNPDTQFIVSFPPYSILSWTVNANNGSLDALINEYKLVITMLSEYENVTIYFFCDATDIIYNLDLYADSIHYNQEINYFMEQEFTKKDSPYIMTSFDSSRFDFLN